MWQKTGSTHLSGQGQGLAKGAEEDAVEARRGGSLTAQWTGAHCVLGQGHKSSGSVCCGRAVQQPRRLSQLLGTFLPESESLGCRATSSSSPSFSLRCTLGESWWWPRTWVSDLHLEACLESGSSYGPNTALTFGSWEREPGDRRSFPVCVKYIN